MEASKTDNWCKTGFCKRITVVSKKPITVLPKNLILTSLIVTQVSLDCSKKEHCCDLLVYMERTYGLLLMCDCCISHLAVEVMLVQLGFVMSCVSGSVTDLGVQLMATPAVLNMLLSLLLSWCWLAKMRRDD